jgi:hypothetical protein
MRGDQMSGLNDLRRIEHQCLTFWENCSLFIANICSGIFFLAFGWMAWRAFLVGTDIYHSLRVRREELDDSIAGNFIAILLLAGIAVTCLVTSASCQIIGQTIRNRASIRASALLIRSVLIANAAKDQVA